MRSLGHGCTSCWCTGSCAAVSEPFYSAAEHGKIGSMINRCRYRFRRPIFSVVITCLAVAGCKHDVWEHQRSDVITQYRVPPSAKTVAEGVGPIEFTAPDRGLIYII